MKKLIAAMFVFSFLMFSGCSSGTGMQMPLSLSDYIGDWFMSGTLVLDIGGRTYEEDVNRVVYIREGYIVDSYGIGYTPRLANNILMLTCDEGFDGYDDYCGFFEGGAALTYTFVGINPFFDQAYQGMTQGETAVFTKHCNYKQAKITGIVYLERTH